MAKNEYLIRHNKISGHLPYSLCKLLGTEMIDKWYIHTPTHPNQYVNIKYYSVMESRGTHRQRSYSK